MRHTESLESRQLFAVSVAAFSVTRPSTIVTNQVFPVAITLENKGDAPITNPGYKLYLSNDINLSSNDTLIKTGTAELTIQPGAQGKFENAATVTAPATAGEYYLILQSTTDDATPADNTSSARLVVSEGTPPPATTGPDLVVTLDTAKTKNLESAYTLGAKKAPKTASITANLANTAALVDKKNKSSITASLLLTKPDGSTETLKTVKVKANKFSSTKVAPVKFTFAPKKSLTTAGNYSLSVTLDTTAIGDANTSNNSVVVRSFTASTSGGETPGGTAEHPFPGSNLPATLYFKQKSSILGGSVETGDVQPNATGTAVLATWQRGEFQTGIIDFQLSVTENGKEREYTGQIGNKTLTFGVPEASSSGYLTLDNPKNTKIFFLVS